MGSDFLNTGLERTRMRAAAGFPSVPDVLGPIFFSSSSLKRESDQKEKKSRRANRTQPSRLSLLEAKHAGTGRQSQMLVREPDSAADKVRSDRGLATKPGQQASKRVPKRKKCARLAALFRVLDDSDIDSESLSVTSRVFRRDCDPRGV